MILENPDPQLEEPIGVIGYGVEGQSTCRYLLARGYTRIHVFDRLPPKDLDPRLAFASPSGPDASYLSGLSGMRTAFRSAGVRPDTPEIQAFAESGGVLTSQVGMAFALAGRSRIIGVTGTVGKGTCCSLLQSMLQEAGIKCRLGGNIGIPALEVAGGLAEGEWLILELSSFQLSALAQSPAVAVVLRTTSEHLDWHPTQQEYWRHKANLAARQGPGDVLVYCSDAPGSAWIGAQGGGRKIAYGQGQAPDIRIEGERLSWVTRGLTLSLSETRLMGAFNLENVAAAAAAALSVGGLPSAVRRGAAAFPGLEHRLEFVRERHGLAYYNDSYATRPEATLGALAALSPKPLGLILGGSEKHADFAELAAAIASAPHVKAIALIGQTAPRLRTELDRAREAGRNGRPTLPGAGHAACRECGSLEAALAFLGEHVGAGGAIALSPACASFGMFENYKERGKAFKRLVQGLG